VKKKRFSVEQIVGVLKQVEMGVPGGGADPPSRHQRANSVSLEETVPWTGNRPGSPDQTAAERKREAEETGGRVNPRQDHAPGCVSKKTLTPSRRRPLVSCLRETYRVSERRACCVARVARSTFLYQSVREPRTALRLGMREIAQTRVRYG
jgi:hypothetical protein